ncbi:TPA: recombinase family protein [Streptococcus pyogenes]|nr:recombinase family protein [Streptococcus pyogenes]
MRKVAIYSRVSTINQAEEGYSIQGQIEALTKYCEAMEWKIYKNYSDAGFSGGKLERPAITELIEDGKNNKFDTILVYKLDRLSRNVKDTLYLIDITPLKKEIEIIDKKINRLNDLYINDLIDLPKLKKDIEELNHLKDDYNKAIKLNYLDKKNEDSLGMLMDNLDIRKSSYDVQSRIVKQLIDRVEVTMDNIDIIFKF